MNNALTPRALLDLVEFCALTGDFELLELVDAARDGGDQAALIHELVAANMLSPEMIAD